MKCCFSLSSVCQALKGNSSLKSQEQPSSSRKWSRGGIFLSGIQKKLGELSEKKESGSNIQESEENVEILEDERGPIRFMGPQIQREGKSLQDDPTGSPLKHKETMKRKASSSSEEKKKASISLKNQREKEVKLKETRQKMVKKLNRPRKNAKRSEFKVRRSSSNAEAHKAQLKSGKYTSLKANGPFKKSFVVKLHYNKEELKKSCKELKRMHRALEHSLFIDFNKKVRFKSFSLSRSSKKNNGDLFPSFLTLSPPKKSSNAHVSDIELLGEDHLEIVNNNGGVIEMTPQFGSIKMHWRNALD